MIGTGIERLMMELELLIHLARACLKGERHEPRKIAMALAIRQLQATLAMLDRADIEHGREP